MTQTTKSPAPATRAPIGEPIWVDLDSAAPQQTRDFYAALFGWNYQISEEFGGHATAFAGGHKAAGISPTLPSGVRGPSCWMIYFASGDIQADAERVRKLGGQVLVEPMQIGDQGQMGQFADAAGAPFGLWQDDQHGGFRHNTQPGRLVWCEYNTRDLPQALGFYTALLRATSEKVPGVKYHTLQHQDVRVAGVSGMDKNWQAGEADGWMVYFYAPDVDEMTRTAQQYGGTVLVEPVETRYGRKAMLRDPAGTVFTLTNPQLPGG